MEKVEKTQKRKMTQKKWEKNFFQKIPDMPQSRDRATDIFGKFTRKVENLPEKWKIYQKTGKKRKTA